MSQKPHNYESIVAILCKSSSTFFKGCSASCDVESVSGARWFPMWAPWGGCSPSAWIASDLTGTMCLKHPGAVQLEALCLWWPWIEVFNRNNLIAPVDIQPCAVPVPSEVWRTAGGCCWVQVAYNYLYMRAVFHFCAKGKRQKGMYLASSYEYKDRR